VLLALFTLCACGGVGDKASSISTVYGITAVVALLVLIAYCFIARKKDFWFLLLFSSVIIVNIGYFSLSISKTLEEALLANRIAYFGSVFLPMAMLMIILNTVKIKTPKWLISLLLGIGAAVFLVAASPGYFNIYYKEVSLITVNGVSSLQKVYGSWHFLYLVYLVGYFSAMVAAIAYAAKKKKMETTLHAVILVLAVFVNIGVWFIEQLVKIDFEILAVSYIISELFLLTLNIILRENEKLKELVMQSATSLTDTAVPGTGALISKEAIDQYKAGLLELTQTERAVYEAYVDGKTTKEVMAMLNIKENTLKFHNKNLYGKLGVSSRKQLVQIAKTL